MSIIAHFYRQWNWSAETLNTLPKVTGGWQSQDSSPGPLPATSLNHQATPSLSECTKFSYISSIQQNELLVQNDLSRSHISNISACFLDGLVLKPKMSMDVRVCVSCSVQGLCRLGHRVSRLKEALLSPWIEYHPLPDASCSSVTSLAYRMLLLCLSLFSLYSSICQ